jgi:hypothetical protein
MQIYITFAGKLKFKIFKMQSFFNHTIDLETPKVKQSET